MNPIVRPRSVTRFLLPAGIGILIFLVPVSSDGATTIVFSVITNSLRSYFEPLLLPTLLALLGASALGASVITISRKRFDETGFFARTFSASRGALLLRWTGFLITASVYTGIGPEIIRLPDTGTTVVNDIGINVMVIYFVGLAFMPLLTEFGLMEFVGTLCKPAFQRLFRLPGRAAVDATTSVVSASAIGLLLTLSQHEKGAYSTREASVIACSFSIVSIPFSLLIAKVSGIESLFFGWYLSVLFTCFLCALLLSRSWPLALLPDTKRLTAKANVSTEHPTPDGGVSTFQLAWNDALIANTNSPGVRDYLLVWLRDFPKFSMGVIGSSIAIATFASILMFHTTVVNTLTMPLSWVLESMGVEEASAIAPGLLIGFVDQFLPALIASNVDSTFWKFVLAGLSVTQLIFMSEFGLLVLRSSLPLSIYQLASVFVLRTLIGVPVLMLCATLLTSSDLQAV